jgi:hypothetical protein
MATRSRTTFKKRQKELARMEKQRDKAAKRVQRKLTKTGEPGEGPPIEGEEPDLLDLEPEPASDLPPENEP